MANASKKHVGPGAQGKNSGTGAMTPESVADGLLGENQVLSNRDKSQHTGERGLDSRAVQNEQRQDNARNQQKPIDMDHGNASALSPTKSMTSGQDSSLESQHGQAGSLANPDPGVSLSRKDL